MPELSAYLSTEPGDVFDLDQAIVLESWDIEECFFSFEEIGYNTTFGLSDEVCPKKIPELYFNIVLKRRFMNAFIINLLPLLTVAALLFAVLMTVTTDWLNSNGRAENVSRYVLSFGYVASLIPLFILLFPPVRYRSNLKSYYRIKKSRSVNFGL